ncbi:unnamed protein product [Prorocentrum cordatum]|uniref:Uncharacterized protein n=1 Tax=Prorocentrum cordatum TaxID=2364126 RepID=A0ABN9PAH6_9DINO|nr:unnamed protein product [Polarella glacialis]
MSNVDQIHEDPSEAMPLPLYLTSTSAKRGAKTEHRATRNHFNGVDQKRGLQLGPPSNGNPQWPTISWSHFHLPASVIYGARTDDRRVNADIRAGAEKQLTSMETSHDGGIEDEYQAELELKGFATRRPTSDRILAAHNAQAGNILNDRDHGKCQGGSEFWGEMNNLKENISILTNDEVAELACSDRRKGRDASCRNASTECQRVDTCSHAVDTMQDPTGYVPTLPADALALDVLPQKASPRRQSPEKPSAITKPRRLRCLNAGLARLWVEAADQRMARSWDYHAKRRDWGDEGWQGESEWKRHRPAQGRYDREGGDRGWHEEEEQPARPSGRVPWRSSGRVPWRAPAEPSDAGEGDGEGFEGEGEGEGEGEPAEQEGDEGEPVDAAGAACESDAEEQEMMRGLDELRQSLQEPEEGAEEPAAEEEPVQAPGKIPAWRGRAEEARQRSRGGGRRRVRSPARPRAERSGGCVVLTGVPLGYEHSTLVEMHQTFGLEAGALLSAEFGEHEPEEDAPGTQRVVLEYADEASAQLAAGGLDGQLVQAHDGRVQALRAELRDAAPPPRSSALPAVRLSGVPDSFTEEMVRELHEGTGVADADVVSVELLDASGETRACVVRYQHGGAAARAARALEGKRVLTASGAQRPDNQAPEADIGEKRPAERLESMPTFPPQESKAGKGKGSAPPRTASCAAHKRRALPPHGSPAATIVDDDMPPRLDDDDDASEDYIKQCCADMLAKMREELAVDISKSLTDTIKQNIEVQNKPTIDLLDQLRAQLAQPPADLDQKILSIVRPQLDSTARRLQAQLDAQQTQINETDNRVSKVEAQMQDVLSQLEVLRKELLIAEQRPRAPLTQPKGFDREVDASLVVAMAQRPTTTACVEAELRPWIASLGLADDLYDLVPVGPVPTKKFHIRFKGLVAVASRMAAKVLGSLRVDGTWKEFTVEVPGSPRCRIHLGPDKSPRQIRCEILLRRARTIIAERHPNLRLFTDRERATLSVGWDRIMRAEAHPGNKPAEFFWDNQQLAKHDLVKAELVSLLAPLIEPEAEPQCHAVALVPGRVLRVTVVCGPICMEIFNIHNHDLKQEQVKEIVEIILEARAAALRAPSQHLVLVVGDFNFAAERVGLLKSYWGPVFSRKPWDHDRAVEHAAKYLPTVDDVVLPPPTPRLLRAVLARAADSATGCDGLSYTAWRSMPFGATILWDCLEWVMSGQALFDSASTTLQVFLPKNVTEDEAQVGQVARGADKVRVLSLRNCDVKVLSATMNAALRPILARVAPPCQRGFVPGRNFGLNILELDASSRQLSCTPHGSRDLPILYSLDYGQAFPSLNQEFVLFIIGALRLPEAILKFAGFLYEAIEGVAVSMGLRVHLYWVRKDLAWVALVMREAELVANLVLKIQKCHIVPLSASFSPALASEALGRLSRTVPHWSAMKIVSELLYLGIWLGPSVDSMKPWIDPLAKARLRARAVGRGVTPASLSSIIYNTRIVSTLSYVSQFFWMPRAALACELGVLAQVFRVALGTFPLSARVQMDRWRGPRALSWAHLDMAPLLRAAAHTFPEHQRLLDDLRAHACALADSRTLYMIGSGAPCPGFWRSPAIVENLALALDGPAPAAPSTAAFGFMAAAVSMYNAIRLIPDWPISEQDALSAALAGVSGPGMTPAVIDELRDSDTDVDDLILSSRLDLVDDSVGYVAMLSDAGSSDPDGYPFGADHHGHFSDGGSLVSGCHEPCVLGHSAFSEAMAFLSTSRVLEILPSVYISDVPTELSDDVLIDLHKGPGGEDAEIVAIKHLPAKDPLGETRCCIVRYRSQAAADRAIEALSGTQVLTTSGRPKFLGARLAKPAQWMREKGASSPPRLPAPPPAPGRGSSGSGQRWADAAEGPRAKGRAEW